MSKDKQPSLLGRWGAAERREKSPVTIYPPAGSYTPPAASSSNSGGVGSYYGNYTPGSYSNNAGGGYAKDTGPKCSGDHDGDVVVLTLANGATIRGADRHGALLHRPDLVFDLAGFQPECKPFIKSKGGWEALNELQRLVPIVRCEWPDGEAPWTLPIGFWQGVIARIPAAAQVVACCHGGHGRTGTFLVALMITEGWTYKDAIAAVREGYCPKAVETFQQAQYLRLLAEDAGRLGLTIK